LHCAYNEVTEEETVELTHESEPLKLSVIDNLLVVGWLEGRCLLDLSSLEWESVGAVVVVCLGGEKVTGVQLLKGTLASEDIHRVCKFALQNRK
jgi:hypothetical protein